MLFKLKFPLLTAAMQVSKDKPGVLEQVQIAAGSTFSIAGVCSNVMVHNPADESTRGDQVYIVGQLEEGGTWQSRLTLNAFYFIAEPIPSAEQVKKVKEALEEERVAV